jgi:ATP:cob(I)alamin adenosyltransferase
MERRAKVDDAFSVLGDTDELNAHVGLAREHVRPGAGLRASAADEADGALSTLTDRLSDIQSRLLDIGSAVATPLDSERSTPAALERARFDGDAHAAALEGWIDAMDAELPPLRNFILPGGGLASAQLHVARTVCRRAERGASGLVARGAAPPGVAVYLNRLSDFLFVAARFAAARQGMPEVVYRKVRAR